MLSASLLSIAALTVPSALAASLRDQLPGVPAGWSVSGTPDASQSITLKLAVKQQNIDQLEGLLKSVSDPSSPNYGKYYTADQVNALFAPSSGSVDAVTSWAKTASLDNSLDRGLHVTIKTTIGNANEVFGANFTTFKDESTGVEKLRTLQYSVPDEISSHVDFVSPTTFFGRTNAESALRLPENVGVERREPVSEPQSGLTKRALACVSYSARGTAYLGPDCWKQVYNVTYVPDASSGSRIGFGSFLNESAIEADLFLYEQKYGIPKQSFNVTLINGGVNHQEPEYTTIGEANLDAQNIFGLAHPLPVTEFITGGSPPFLTNLDLPTEADNSNEPYLDYYAYLLSQSNEALPQVISNSYGDDEQTVPIDYARYVCNQIGMMGLRGITILESSGDTGVGAPCQSNDGKKTPQFTPAFPGTCPYITAVGGTQGFSEEAWDGSTGGFSNYFPRAWYQESAVETYLGSYISKSVQDYYTPFTNFSARGFPDVSAHSSNPYWPVYANGVLALYSGTSAAAPAWAGFIALLNDARFKAGQPALGFVNPLFYSLKSGFTDVTEGAATGCNGVNAQTGAKIPGASIIPWATWNATVGWDPVTGLGVPNFGVLLDTLGLSAYNKTATPSCPSWNTLEYTPSTGSTYKIECGTDHAGGVFSQIYVNGTDRLNNCIMACEGTNGCIDVQLSGTTCYLKGAVGTAVSKPGAVGARLISQPIGKHAQLTDKPSCPSWNNTILNVGTSKYFVECGVDHQGGDLKLAYVNSTIQGCVAACDQTPGCIDSSLSGSACYLKSKVGKAVPNSNVFGTLLISKGNSTA
ncbi:subtilisin-like protein [Aureobasidium pullulans]|uniref:tripeptidyl-peptidase II n=1 Tax=Aureobasidium pullulans TaxID=5580 RepID=A0A4T0EP20_AURPU|nr:subtilisin-like protein [Aureobasidium pullulans]